MIQREAKLKTIYVNKSEEAWHLPSYNYDKKCAMDLTKPPIHDKEPREKIYFIFQHEKH